MPVPVAGTEAAIRGGRMPGLVASGLVRRPATIRYVPDTRLQRLEEASDPQGSWVSYRYSTFGNSGNSIVTRMQHDTKEA